MREVKIRYPYKELVTVPGIGEILGITIMLETETSTGSQRYQIIPHTAVVFHPKKISNGKKKGEGNKEERE